MTSCCEHVVRSTTNLHLLPAWSPSSPLADHLRRPVRYDDLASDPAGDRVIARAQGANELGHRCFLALFPLLLHRTRAPLVSTPPSLPSSSSNSTCRRRFLAIAEGFVLSRWISILRLHAAHPHAYPVGQWTPPRLCGAAVSRASAADAGPAHLGTARIH
jgi:hypothetical protein